MYQFLGGLGGTTMCNIAPSWLSPVVPMIERQLSYHLELWIIRPQTRGIQGSGAQSPHAVFKPGGPFGSLGGKCVSAASLVLPNPLDPGGRASGRRRGRRSLPGKGPQTRDTKSGALGVLPSSVHHGKPTFRLSGPKAPEKWNPREQSPVG